MLLRTLTAVACWWVLALTPNTAGAATPPDALSGYQHAVEAQMQELVRHTLVTFFKSAHHELPQHIDINTNSEFDLAKSEPTITHLALDVTLTSDLPAEVIREARQELVKTLASNGYRSDASQSGSGPLMSLTIDVQPVDHPEEHSGPREYAIFAALIGGALTAAILAINLLRRGLPGGQRRRQAHLHANNRGRGQANAHTQNNRPAARQEPAHYWPQADSPAALPSGSQAGSHYGEHEWPRREPSPDLLASSALPPLPQSPSANISRPLTSKGLPPLRADQVQRET